MTDRNGMDILTCEEAAAWLKLPEKSVLAMCRQGRVPGAVKFGKHWRLSRSGLESLFSVEAPAPSPPMQSNPQPSRGRTRASTGGTVRSGRTRADILRALQAPPEAEP